MKTEMIMLKRECVPLMRIILFACLTAVLVFFLLNNRPEQKSFEQIRYAVVLDAGSTGSRVHVYTIVTSKKGPRVTSEVFEQIRPGLSSYADDPDAAARSLKTLLDIAKDSVPKAEHACTPMILRATAGLRLISNEKSKAILKKVEQTMQSYGFYMPSDAVEIMDGIEEGVYAWITVNFLLKRFGPEKLPTVAIMDLGGGSTQIVFEPKKSSIMDDVDDSYKYTLEFGKHKYHLYQYSYLGFGLMEARKKAKSLNGHQPLACLPSGFSERLSNAGNEAILIQGKGGSFDECRESILPIFEKDKECGSSTCSFAGVFQPPLDHFPDELFAFSYFFDRTSTMDRPEPPQITAADYAKEAERLCSSENKDFKELQENFHACFDLTFIYSLLRDGYGIPEKKTLHLAKKITGYETGWCLGAAIKVLENTDVCPSK